MPAKSPGESAVHRLSVGAPSARQAEILQHIAFGRSNKEIARELGLTEGTIKQHIYALYRKLGVRNRTQALKEGLRLSLAGAAPEIVAAAGVPSFARRLVTAVVMLPRPALASEEAQQLERLVAGSRRKLADLAAAFDATPEPLSGGGLAAWFGQPMAHGDDVERAVAFVRAVRRFGLDEGAVPWTLGVASAAELLGEDGAGAIAYRTLHAATLFAGLAALAAPLACQLTAQFALLPAAGPSEAKFLPVGAAVVRPAPAPAAAVATLWGGLPFCAELVGTAQRRRSQWLAVESWPPESGTRLLCAIGEYLAARGVQVRTLWAPAGARAVAAPELFLRQLEPEAASEATGGISLADALLRLASRRVALVVVHGVDALETLKTALGANGLARMKEGALIIAAGAMQRRGEAQTIVRLLGADPVSAPFVRVLRLEVPSAPQRPDLGVRGDVQAVLDRMSPEAREVARAAARPDMGRIGVVARRLGLSPRQMRERCAELEHYGLLRVDGDALVFRDELTAAAVRASLL